MRDQATLKAESHAAINRAEAIDRLLKAHNFPEDLCTIRALSMCMFFRLASFGPMSDGMLFERDERRPSEM
jgi:hypothetical protein